MKLIAYRIPGIGCPIRPASPNREWMDQSRDRFAYRCLPLTTANSHGWEILCPAAFEAHWNGGAKATDITVTPLGEEPMLPISHFGGGVLTFHTGFVFRTESPYNLYVTGPVNSPKDGIVALTGVVETDWLPFPFTMNWMFTSADLAVRFEQGEPFCHVFPVRRDLVEVVEPELRELDSDPALKEMYEQWNASRTTFIRELPVDGTNAHAQGWQKNYMRGRHPDGERGAEDHRTRLRVKPFAERPTG